MSEQQKPKNTQKVTFAVWPKKGQKSGRI